jgi:MATE family multidrug resistance protein
MRLIETLRKRADEPQGYRYILRVGMPLVAGMASTTVIHFTDRIFLSRYSVDAIAAALPASLASMTLSLTLMGVCGYTSVLIAQYVGSGALQRIGSALWQGLWFALVGAVLLALTWWPAEWLFSLTGYTEAVQQLGVTYFRVLNLGSGFFLAGSAMAGFFSGRGQTRPVMIANMSAALINVPLDYLLIFGGFGIPALGILGAGIATIIGWSVSALIMARLIFTRKNDEMYHVRRGFPFEWDMFRRLMRFGLPSGANLFMELIAVTWFAFAVGAFGTVALAASNIVFALNSLVFVPMLGLNIAVASLVGQAMGRGRPDEAERVTMNTLHLAFAYMLPLAAFLALAAGPLMDIFAPGDLSPQDFVPVRELGVMLLYFIAVYTVVDAGNIVFFGALKGAGDTLGVMYLLSGGLVFLVILPIAALKYLGLASVISYWVVFTVYIMLLAGGAVIRFYRRSWHKIQVVETMPEA